MHAVRQGLGEHRGRQLVDDPNLVEDVKNLAQVHSRRVVVRHYVTSFASNGQRGLAATVGP